MAVTKGKLHEGRRREGMSGLKGTRRYKARSLTKRACKVAVAHRDTLTYSQGPRRWDGIDKKKNPFENECPRYADCSSSTTWILWSVLHEHYGFKQDFVNGTDYEWGWTGTISKHGKVVKHRINWRVGDVILYGDPFGRTGHVVIYIGGGMVFSFGGEPGPRILPWNYRDDFHSCRRFI